MSVEKIGAVHCNGDFILTVGDKSCDCGGYYSTKDTELYLSIHCSNIDIGNAVNESLSKCILFPYSEETMDALMKESEEHQKAEFKYVSKEYGYKTVSAYYKNMMSLEIDISEGKLSISPMRRTGRGAWNGLEDENDIIIRTETPAELVGGAVRYAFVRCRGNGAGKVEEALFPEGRPPSIEEYLASINLFGN